MYANLFQPFICCHKLQFNFLGIRDSFENWRVFCCFSKKQINWLIPTFSSAATSPSFQRPIALIFECKKMLFRNGEFSQLNWAETVSWKFARRLHSQFFAAEIFWDILYKKIGATFQCQLPNYRQSKCRQNYVFTMSISSDYSRQPPPPPPSNGLCDSQHNLIRLG
jgi:hypothetical protein